jgi:hypothetical protein
MRRGARGMSWGVRMSAAAAVVAAILLPSGSTAEATVSTPSSPASILISDLSNGTPYPSSISAGGLVGPVQDVNATLVGYSHTCPEEFHSLLVGPGGQHTVLLSDAGSALGFCAPAATNLTVTLDDEAAQIYPCGASPAGIFKPTARGLGCADDLENFPGPAPAAPHAVSLSIFDGADPNGSWSLYAMDSEGPGDSGSIAGGWSLTIDTPANTRIAKAPRSKSSVRKAKYKFSSDEANSTFECSLDGKRFRPCTSPFKRKVGEGKHRFRVRATDAQGGTDASPATDKFKIVG